MYADGNPKTKAAFKRLVAAGGATIFSPGEFPPKRDGVEYVEGPHYPKPHTWYAQVTMQDGVVIKIK